MADTLTPETATKPDIWQLAPVLPSAHPELRRERTLNQIKRIVVHIDDEHRPKTYDPTERYYAQALYHMHRNWSDNPEAYIPGFGLMYHYRISLNGGKAQIWQTQPETLITWHAYTWNLEGLAICIDGKADQPTDPAIEYALHNWLLWQCYHRPEITAGRGDVYGHCEEPTTTHTCPTLYLPYVQAFREGRI